VGRTMKIGEIIETTTSGFVAESEELNRPPALGSLVKVQVGGADYAYGVVSYGTTTSPEPGRRAVRRSTDEVFDEAIYDEHPQLWRILHTEFNVILVGWVEDGVIHQHLPPQPPPLHHSVYQCEPEEVKAFTQQLYYLRLLLSAPGEVSSEQFVAAHVREAYRQRGEDAKWLERAAREMASLLKHEYERLMTLLYAIEPAREVSEG
jgi:hypothetical protein